MYPVPPSLFTSAPRYLTTLPRAFSPCISQLLPTITSAPALTEKLSASSPAPSTRSPSTIQVSKPKTPNSRCSDLHQTLLPSQAHPRRCHLRLRQQHIPRNRLHLLLWSPRSGAMPPLLPPPTFCNTLSRASSSSSPACCGSCATPKHLSSKATSSSSMTSPPPSPTRFYPASPHLCFFGAQITLRAGAGQHRRHVWAAVVRILHALLRKVCSDRTFTTCICSSCVLIIAAKALSPRLLIPALPVCRHQLLQRFV